MKKSMLGLVCLIGVMSCEMPRSIQIKANPVFYVPLGSPFAGLEEEQRLEYLISTENIKKMMGEKSDGTAYAEIGVYDYRGDAVGSIDPSKVQTYLVHYPIISDFSLNLEDDIEKAIKNDAGEAPTYRIPATYNGVPLDQFFNIPGRELYLTGGGGGLQPAEGEPLFEVDLANMSKLVTEVNGSAFGLQIPWSQSFEDNIRVCIPAFGLGMQGNTRVYARGESQTVGGERVLRFIGGATTIAPKSLPDGKLHIYFKALGFCSGDITLDLVFDWDTATLNTSEEDNGLAKTETINNSLRDFLGSGVEFNNVYGFIYVNGLDDTESHMALKVNNNNLIDEDASELMSRPRLSLPVNGTVFTGRLPTHSLTQGFVQLNSIFNTESTSSTLTYEISIDELVIRRAEVEAGEKKTVSADLVILLPLELSVKNEAPEPYKAGYVKLDMEELTFDLGDKDLFFRNEGDEGNIIGDLFELLDFLTVVVQGSDINIIDLAQNPLVLLISAGNESQLIEFTDKKTLSIRLNKEFLKINPFIPTFDVLLKKDTNKDFGTFRILRTDKPAFDFKLEIEAAPRIDYTQKLF